MKYRAAIDGETFEIEVLTRGGETLVRIGEEEIPVDFRRVRGEASYSLLMGAESRPISFERRPDGLSVTVESESYVVSVEDERTRAARSVSGGTGSRDKSKVLLSMMPGIVREIRVAPGDAVAKGQPLLILEAMKMQNEIRAVMDGTVKTVHVEANKTVNKGDPLITLE